jgi:hypothetical protein
MRINLTNERYCHKCHKIKAIVEFIKKPNRFLQSGVCHECTKRN